MISAKFKNQVKEPVFALIAAVIGAAVTSVLQLLFLLRADAELDIVSFALAAITGAIIGWGYRLATRLQSVSQDALDRLDSATNALEYQRKPLAMLINERQHPNTVRLLLSGSLMERYRYISYVDENEYLQYLLSAISESNKCEGVRHGPIRLFKSDDSDVGADDETTQKYLNALRDKRMKENADLCH